MSPRLARRSGGERTAAAVDRLTDRLLVRTSERGSLGDSADPRTARRVDLTPPMGSPGAVLLLPSPGSTDDARRAALALCPVVVVDVRPRVERGKGDAALSAVHLRMWEARHGRIPPGAAVLLLSGPGSDGRHDCERPSPGLTAEAATWLVTRRRVALIGSDACGPDAPYGPAGTTTAAVLAVGGAILHHVGPHLTCLRAQGDWLCVHAGSPTALTAFAGADRSR